jgi:hypothetical protein
VRVFIQRASVSARLKILTLHREHGEIEQPALSSPKERFAIFGDRNRLRVREAVRGPFLPSLTLPSSG